MCVPRAARAARPVTNTRQYVINNSVTAKSGKQLSFATVMLGEVNLARELVAEGCVRRCRSPPAHPTRPVW